MGEEWDPVKEIDQSTPYGQGLSAGWSSDDAPNPYKEGTPEHEEWAKGERDGWGDKIASQESTD